MDIKRKAARVIAILAIALGAGHFVQSMGKSRAPKPAVSAELAQKLKAVETVAAGPALGSDAAPKPEKPVVVALAAAVPAPAPTPKPVAETPQVQLAELAPAAPEPSFGTLPKPAAPALVETETAPVAPAPPAVAAEEAAQPMPCDVSLDLIAEPSAMIGITLLAPCNPNERVVLRHAGLAVTGLTTASGALFTALPAMATDATVEVAFADGTKTEASLAVPELAALRRFGVQWQAEDAFQVHAFENGAGYGEPGHVSAADPHRPVSGQSAVGGFLTLAGDSTTENPLLAEIYTFPADPAAKPDVVVEAAVTDKTCGRELIGETLITMGGETYVTDLTLAMPECDAIGDYMVLKNLVPDMNMAAAN